MKTLEILFLVVCALTTIAGIVTALTARKILKSVKAETVRP